MIKCTSCNDTGAVCCINRAGYYCECSAGRELQQCVADTVKELYDDAEGDS